MFSRFWRWNKFENRSIFDEVEAYETKCVSFFGATQYAGGVGSTAAGDWTGTGVRSRPTDRATGEAGTHASGRSSVCYERSAAVDRPDQTRGRAAAGRRVGSRVRFGLVWLVVTAHLRSCLLNSAVCFWFTKTGCLPKNGNENISGLKLENGMLNFCLTVNFKHFWYGLTARYWVTLSYWELRFLVVFVFFSLCL